VSLGDKSREFENRTTSMKVEFSYIISSDFFIIFHLLSQILLILLTCKVLILPGQPVAKPLERMASFDWRDETYNPRLLGVAQKALTTSWHDTFVNVIYI